MPAPFDSSVRLLGIEDTELVLPPLDWPEDAASQALLDGISRAIRLTLGSYARSGRCARRALLERYMAERLTPTEAWTASLLAPPQEIRTRFASFVERRLGLRVRPQGNTWGTWEVDRSGGPVEHYMLLPTTLRRLMRHLEEVGLRPAGGQNPFEKDGWHLEGEAGRRAYCMARYGENSDRVAAFAGAHFLPAKRRLYARSLFNPAGVGQAMSEAVRARIGDHVVSNLMEVIADSAARFDDLRDCTALDWPDLGDVLMARNKGGGPVHQKPVVIRPATLAGLQRRIDLDHAKDPRRADMATLRAWTIAGDVKRLASFKLFQKEPGRGDAPPTYSSFHELVSKACRAANVTVGRGAVSRLATSRWPRRERVDGMMLDLLRRARTTEDLAHGRRLIMATMGWRSDQCSNYGSHAEAAIALERQREAIRLAEEARRGPTAPRPSRTMSASAEAAAAHAMRRSGDPR